MTDLSVIVITRDEAHNLPRCLDSVSFADEIVIVDSGSRDGTQEIARRYTDKVYELPWEGFGPTKQAALERATGYWVLSLDADEELDRTLAAAVKQVVRGPEQSVCGFRANRLSNFLGTWIRHSGWYPDRVVRLGRRSRMRFSPDHIHERLIIDGPTSDLEGHMLHYTDPDFRHYLKKLARYADLSARGLHAEGRRAGWFDIVIRPAYQFCKSYLLKAGFLDGRAGFILACGSSFHVFTKYVRLWELGRETPACSS